MLILSLAAPAQPQAASADGPRKLVTAPPGFTESCGRYEWLCSNGAAGARSFGEAELLELAKRINRRVNRSVTEISDPENYGVAEYWTLPRNGRGDCEDFVLEKYKLLLDAGVDSRALTVAVAMTRRGENHAVLVLRHASGDLVLDSLSRKIRPWNETGYRYLAMQSRDDKRQWEIVAKRSKRSNLLASR